MVLLLLFLLPPTFINLFLDRHASSCRSKKPLGYLPALLKVVKLDVRSVELSVHPHFHVASSYAGTCLWTGPPYNQEKKKEAPARHLVV